METEFKFRLDDVSVFDRIVESAELKSMGIDEVESIEMRATYFDTADYDLHNKGIAYRIRMEEDSDMEEQAADAFSLLSEEQKKQVLALMQSMVRSVAA